MANFLHSSAYLPAGEVVEVTLDQQANVMLLDTNNFSSYRNGMAFHYYGGLATRSPYRIQVPHSGNWNLVIDLGGGSGFINYSIRTFNPGLVPV